MSEPLAELADAIQTFVNSFAEGPELVDSAVVVWEAVSFDDDGQAQRRIRYCVPTANFSMSSAIGLLSAGTHYVRRDILDFTDED